MPTHRCRNGFWMNVCVCVCGGGGGGGGGAQTSAQLKLNVSGLDMYCKEQV